MSARAIAALVSIIRDERGVAVTRRIITAETLLSYEAPPYVI
jgi:hypothetical protein